MSDIASAIMAPVYYAMTGVMLAWHSLLVGVMPTGLAWAAAIVGLAIIIRGLLTPLSVRDIKARLTMRDLEPQLEEIRKKYGHDRKQFARENQKVLREAAYTPFAGCLTHLLQLPLLLMVFLTIDRVTQEGAASTRGFFSMDDAESLSSAKMLGINVADTLVNSASTEASVLAATLLIVIGFTEFRSRQVTLSYAAPYAQQEKILLYALPIVFGLGGMIFSLGALLYWATWNMWTLAEHTLVIRRRSSPCPP